MTNSLTLLLKIVYYLDGSDGTQSECGGFQVISWSSVHQVELFSQQEFHKIPEHCLKEQHKCYSILQEEQYR
jgi:hypothetical protein